MPDVTDMLRALPQAVTPEPAGPDIAAADLARGHRALSRRRHRRLAGAAGAVAVTAAVTVVIAQPAQSGKSAPPTAGATSPQSSTIRLTAYTGTQPVGFEVATVPVGWQVVDSDAYSFVVAPPGASTAPASGGPSAEPSASADTGVSFEGRIAVMLQGMSQLPKDETVTTVTVNGRPGQLGLADGGTAKTRDEWLIYPDSKGRKILIQLPTSIGLTTTQLVKFADGITVTDAAKAGLG